MIDVHDFGHGVETDPYLHSLVPFAGLLAVGVGDATVTVFTAVAIVHVVNCKNYLLLLRFPMML